MTRIFVRNIPAQASKDDLHSLFAKISPVSEVYVPPPTITTLRRNFAIVCIEGDDAEGKKCVKALNNSVWKGEKLSIEMANEYHKDRIAREKEDEMDNQYRMQKLAQDALIVVPLPPVTKEVISLRRNRAQELPTAISMNPSVGSRPDKPKKNAKKVIVPCGVKLIFDEDLLVSGRVNYAEDSSDSEAEADTKGKASADGKSGLAEGLGSDMAKIVTKLNSGEVKPIGGGMRKGFGVMSLPTAPEVRIAAPVQKVVDFAPKSHLPTHKVDCCIDEHDLHAPSHLLDEDEQSVEEEPCLTEADLTQEVLSQDRNRALDIFNSLPIGPDGLVIPLNKKKLARDAAKEAKNPTQVIQPPQNEASGDLTTSKKDEALSATQDKCVKAKDEKKAEKKVNKVEFAEDEDIFMFESDIKIDAPVVVSKVQKEPNDILKEIKAQQQKDQEPKKSETQPTTITDKSKSDAKSDTSNSADAVQTVAAEEEEDILKTKDGFANMNVLKNIFYKEGGVWWGDDGTLSGAVGKGSAALDPLFLEAEKHGIDIRTAQKMSGGENMEVEEVAEEKQMLFGFFGGDDSAGSDVPVNPFLSKATSGVNNSMVGIFGGSTSSAVGEMTGEALSVLANEEATTSGAGEGKEKAHQARVSTLVETEAPTTAAGAIVKSRPVEVTIDAAQMVALAKKFARDKSVDALTTEWREGRDRLVLDYKRKRKDMKRRTAAWSNSNPLTASSNTSSSADKVEKTPSGGGGGSSVAGSSRGPQYMRGQRGGVGRKRARKN